MKVRFIRIAPRFVRPSNKAKHVVMDKGMKICRITQCPMDFYPPSRVKREIPGFDDRVESKRATRPESGIVFEIGSITSSTRLPQGNSQHVQSNNINSLQA
jgi:hypothetical protein